MKTTNHFTPDEIARLQANRDRVTMATHWDALLDVAEAYARLAEENTELRWDGRYNELEAERDALRAENVQLRKNCLQIDSLYVAARSRVSELNAQLQAANARIEKVRTAWNELVTGCGILEERPGDDATMYVVTAQPLNAIRAALTDAEPQS